MNVKKIIISVFFIFSYMLLLYLFLYNNLYSLILLFLVYFLYYYFFIEFKNISIFFYFLLYLGISLFIYFIFWFNWIIFINISLFFLTFHLLENLKNRIKLNLFSYFSINYISLCFLSLWIIYFLMSYYNFDLNYKNYLDFIVKNISNYYNLNVSIWEFLFWEDYILLKTSGLELEILDYTFYDIILNYLNSYFVYFKIWFFLISSILMSFLLKIFYFIFSLLNMLLFNLFKYLGIYKIEKVLIEIKTIS